MVQPVWKSVCQFVVMLNTELAHGPVVPFLGMYTKRSGSTCLPKELSSNVLSSFICNSPQLERTQISFNSEWNLVVPHLSSGAPLCHSNKGQTNDVCSARDRTLNQPSKTTYCVVPCVCSSRKDISNPQ